ncbi:MAG: tRNA (guanosine(37)-N1)-methyltransferase TrmD [Candidatus Paceibacterota bacterium]
MRFHIITLFPNMFDSYLNESILARAKENKLIDFSFYNPRDYVVPTKSQKKNDKPYLRVDDKPYGGGPGMVIQALPILKAVEACMKKIKKWKTKIIFFSPTGKKLDTEYAKKVSKKYTDIILISGRYEGIDARVKKILKAEDISIGDYVLTGGELPSMIVIDTISRQLKGVLGDISSLEESRISSSEMYTRPEVLEYKGKKYRVPKVLTSGNHKKIDEWRAGKA